MSEPWNIIESCDLLEVCGFFRKYAAVEELACRGYLAAYCLGGELVDCKRKEYRKAHGGPPPDDMLPTGELTRPRRRTAARPSKPRSGTPRP